MISSVKAAFQLEIKIIQFKTSTLFQFRFESLLVDDKRIHADNFSFNFIALKCHAKTNELSVFECICFIAFESMRENRDDHWLNRT